MKQFSILIALLCATTGRAANYNVGSDSQLRSAIQNDNANITLTADIDLDNSTLDITNNRTVTINLNGHVLDRKLTKRGEGGGQVFTVRSGATLIINGNGTLPALAAARVATVATLPSLAATSMPRARAMVPVSAVVKTARVGR